VCCSKGACSGIEALRDGNHNPNNGTTQVPQHLLTSEVPTTLLFVVARRALRKST